ncbi:hypothetical protein I8752_06350 [Nostocaceae cyanobacterium CENA369]|uniref:Uncharacterized protein n=1 Tax=Dendronalium phyllosphericum CENA369 TaxID=1725256 RepID=A0A8J7HYI2_9NOST|nr:hypothetical protein [Dendronalium phyllosphericum]MBH8572639.1 hypothetical protein [Dendronalium phyllosphericum CENA369]
MRFNRKLTIASLILPILILWQPTLADSSNNVPPWHREETPSIWNKNKCNGGSSQSFHLDGEVNNPTTYNLQKLQNLRDTLKKENPALITEVTVTFKTGSGERTETYYGISLWELINNPKAGGGLKPGNSGVNTKNSFLRQYVLVDATDCYGAVVAIGEIQPNFEGKTVLVAFAKKGSGNQVVPLTDEGFARLVVPGDKAGGRYVSNVTNILILSAPPSPLKRRYF